jgi:hypothetical protein
MRYSVYTLAFVACAVGVALGRITSGLPKGAASIVSVVLVAVALLVTYQNVQTVLASPWMVQRAPGFLGEGG